MSRNVRRHVILSVVLSLLGGAWSSSPVTAQLPVVGYVIHTVDQRTGVDSHTDGVLGVPVPVDVNRDLLPDVLVEFVGIGAPAIGGTTLPIIGVLLIRKLTHPLDALVEVVIDVPLTNKSVMVGYDGREHGVPREFRAVASVTDTVVDVDTDIVGAAQTLKLRAAVVSGAGTAGPDSTTMTVGLSPVPTSLDFDATTRPDYTSANLSAAGAPPRAEVAVVRRQGGAVFTLDAIVDKVPSRVGIETIKERLFLFRGFGAPPLLVYRQTVHYTASAAIEYVRASLVDRPAGNGSELPTITAAVAELRGAEATDVRVVADRNPVTADKDRYLVRTTLNRPIRVAQLGVSTGKESDPSTGTVPLMTRPDTQEYLRVLERQHYLSVAAQLRGVTSAELDSGDPTRLAFTHTASPLEILIQQDFMRAAGWIRDLPSNFTLTYSPRHNRIEYSGSAGIGEMTADATDPDGLIGRMRHARLVIRRIPKVIELVTDLNGSGLLLNAPDDGSTSQHIGFAEISLWRDTEEPTMPADTDGGIIHEVTRPVREVPFFSVTETNTERIFARATELRTLNVRKTKTCEAEQSKTLHNYNMSGGQIRDFPQIATFERCRKAITAEVKSRGGRKLSFVTRKEALPPLTDKFEYTFAVLENVPPEITATLTDETDSGRLRGTTPAGDTFDEPYKRSRSRIGYLGSRPGNRLTYETNTGDRYVLKASMTPVPITFRYCKARRDGECAAAPEPLSGGEWDKGSLLFDGSPEYTTLDVDDLSTFSAEDRTTVHLSLRRIAYALLTQRNGSGEIYLDTDSAGVVKRVSGEVTIMKDHARELEAIFDRAFHADERVVRWRRPTGFPVLSNESGSMDCSGDTQFTGPLGYPLTPLLCP